MAEESLGSCRGVIHLRDSLLGDYLNSLPGMTFKHWIAIAKPHSLPIPNRLSPSHYGMLQYKAGIPNFSAHTQSDLVRIN